MCTPYFGLTFCFLLRCPEAFYLSFSVSLWVLRKKLRDFQRSMLRFQPIFSVMDRKTETSEAGEFLTWRSAVEPLSGLQTATCMCPRVGEEPGHSVTPYKDPHLIVRTLVSGSNNCPKAPPNAVTSAVSFHVSILGRTLISSPQCSALDLYEKKIYIPSQQPQDLTHQHPL